MGGEGQGIWCNLLSQLGLCRATRGGFPSPRVHIEGLRAPRPCFVVRDEGLRCRNMEAKQTETGQEIALREGTKDLTPQSKDGLRVDLGNP